MLAVVRKPPESMQMPLSLSLRMSIIASAVMPPAKQDRVRGPQSYGSRERLAALWPSWPSRPHPLRSLTLPLLQQLPAGPEAGLGSLHAHRLLGQGEDLGEVEGALATPPAPGLGVGPQRRVFSRDVRANAQLVGDVAGALCGGEGGRGARSFIIEHLFGPGAWLGAENTMVTRETEQSQK